MVTIAALVTLPSMAVAPAAAQSGSASFQVPVQWDQFAGRNTNVGGDVTFDYTFGSGRGRLFYDGELDRFSGTEPWQTLLHNAGVAGSIPAGATTFEIGASAFARVNEGPWSDAGFKGGSIVALAVRELASVTMTGSYAAYVRRFADISPLDQVEHYGSVRVHANLESRTTVAGAVALGWKRYEGNAVEQTGLAPAVVPGNGTGRRGALMTVVPARGSVAASSQGGAVSRTQWSWTARLAQSLDDRTGIWIERDERRNAGDAPPAVVWTPPLFYEDGVYDDPYVIGAKTWRTGAKHAFARGDELQVWAARSERDFAGLEVPELPGLLRKDTLLRAGVEAMIPLTSRAARVGLGLGAGYGYARNRSSDAFEEYTAHIIWLGVQVGF
jgi:hypothetical protein